MHHFSLHLIIAEKLFAPKREMAQYGKSDYWDSRYANDTEPFEWYQHWAGFKDIVSTYLQPASQILVAGCGNSSMIVFSIAFVIRRNE